MSKTLVAYFSRADENYFQGAYRYITVGNTEVAVNHIKDLMDVDVYRMEMRTPYAKDYETCIAEAKKDLTNNARPELVMMLNSIDDYDSIILAYPNYWGTMPMAAFTFLDNFNFSGKTIYPLCTNEGSGMGSSESDIRNTAKGATVAKGLSINGSRVADSKPLIEKWLKNNGLL